MKCVCDDLDIAEDKLYEYSQQMLIYTALSILQHLLRQAIWYTNLTARGYKIFNACESQIKYDLLSNIIFLIGRLPHPQKINQYGGIH